MRCTLVRAPVYVDCALQHLDDALSTEQQRLRTPGTEVRTAVRVALMRRLLRKALLSTQPVPSCAHCGNDCILALRTWPSCIETWQRPPWSFLYGEGTHRRRVEQVRGAREFACRHPAPRSLCWLSLMLARAQKREQQVTWLVLQPSWPSVGEVCAHQVGPESAVAPSVPPRFDRLPSCPASPLLRRLSFMSLLRDAGTRSSREHTQG